jgi:hypothetical protein
MESVKAKPQLLIKFDDTRGFHVSRSSARLSHNQRFEILVQGASLARLVRVKDTCIRGFLIRARA